MARLEYCYRSLWGRKHRPGDQGLESMIQEHKGSRRMHQRRTLQSLPGMESMLHLDSSDSLRYQSIPEDKIHCKKMSLSPLLHPKSRSGRLWGQ